MVVDGKKRVIIEVWLLVGNLFTSNWESASFKECRNTRYGNFSFPKERDIDKEREKKCLKTE